MSYEQQLKEEYLHGRISRREFIRIALGLGLSMPIISAFLAACAAPSGAPVAPPVAAKGNLVFAGSKEILALDPVQMNDADSTYIYTQIHDSVAILDQQYNVKPHLAESWKVSDDGLSYTYTFRKGVPFHDGTELKADDVVFTIDRILANKYPEGRKKEKIDMIDSYSKVDDYTVSIKLKFPYAPFAAAFGNMLIVPKAAIQKLGDIDFGKRPIGCGPFKFVEWVPNDHVTLEGFDKYWLKQPKIAQFKIRPISENAVAVANLISGDVDVINDVVGVNLKQLQGAKDKGIDVLNKPSMLYFFAGFRMNSAPFTDPRFRQAVYLSTDFDATIKALFPPELGVRAYGPIAPGLWPRDDDYLKANAFKRDPEKAKALFKQLIDEKVMTADYAIQISPPPDDVRIKIAEVMVTNLKELGMNAKVVQVDWAAYTTLLEQGTQNVIYFLGTTPSIPDPDASIRWLFSKDGAHGRYLKISQFNDYADWDAKIKKAQSSQKQDERASIYLDLTRTMMKNVFHIPLYYKGAIMAKRDYVKDLDVNPLAVWDIVKPWANVSVERKRT